MDLIPDLKTSVIHLQAIARSGKLFRSRPILMHRRRPGAAIREIVVFSEAQNRLVRLRMDADRVPVLDYEFTPAHGSALLCSEGRALWGVLGGFCPQVTLRGGGESLYGNAFFMRPYPAGATKTCPDWVPEGTGYALRFTGPATHATLPQGAIPRRTGFELTLVGLAVYYSQYPAFASYARYIAETIARGTARTDDPFTVGSCSGRGNMRWVTFFRGLPGFVWALNRWPAEKVPELRNPAILPPPEKAPLTKGGQGRLRAKAGECG